MPWLLTIALPWVKANWRLVAIGVGAVVLLWLAVKVYNSIYNKGAAGVTVEIQRDTINKTEQSRQETEAERGRIDRTPHSDNVDKLP